MTAPAASPGIRVCFCDLAGRSHDDWDAHQGYCLMLDWAMAHGKITPAYFLARLAGSVSDLGITEAEIVADVLAFDQALSLRCPMYPLPGRHERVTLPAACYASEYGFTVHVRGACECR